MSLTKLVPYCSTKSHTLNSLQWSKGQHINGGDKFCLLQNPFANKITLNRTSCFVSLKHSGNKNKIFNYQRWNLQSCESIREIPEIYRTSFDEIELLSIHQNRPVLVTDVMFDWTEFNRMDEYNLNDISAVRLRLCCFQHSLSCGNGFSNILSGLETFVTRKISIVLLCN